MLRGMDMNKTGSFYCLSFFVAVTVSNSGCFGNFWLGQEGLSLSPSSSLLPFDILRVGPPN